MKTMLFAIFLAMILITCDKNDDTTYENYIINDGFYGSSFLYSGIYYWCNIQFSDNKYYDEWPSGGMSYQKSYGCLTTGTYSINKSILTFNLDSFKFEGYPEPCNIDMLLPGEYQINYINNNDSIVFEKETENGKIIYYLKRLDIDI